MNEQIKRLLEDVKYNTSKHVELYSIPGCPACEEFKSKLKRVGVIYEDINMEKNDLMWSKLKEMGGEDFVPQIKVGDTLIKDYEDVNELLSKSLTELIGRKIIIK